MSTTLDKIIEEVQQLPPDEQRLLREKLDTILPSPLSEDEIEDAFERELAADGFISEARPRITDFSPYRDYKPVEVSGQPLSEMIIEERR
jgi:hypothetical protein